MPDKLTDNEIVKALECCCEDSGCPAICPLKDMAYVGDCVQFKSKSALDLINRLQEENEKKDRAFKELIEVARLWKQKYYETKAENEKLKAEVDCYKNWYFNAVEGIKTANDRIDNLLKELGENDGKSR